MRLLQRTLARPQQERLLGPTCAALPPRPLVDESALSGERAAAWRRARERWDWLGQLPAVDQSWIYWGLFHMYQQDG